MNVEQVFHPVRQRKAKREARRCPQCHRIVTPGKGWTDGHHSKCAIYLLRFLTVAPRLIEQYGEDGAIQWLIEHDIARKFDKR